MKDFVDGFGAQKKYKASPGPTLEMVLAFVNPPTKAGQGSDEKNEGDENKEGGEKKIDDGKNIDDNKQVGETRKGPPIGGPTV